MIPTPNSELYLLSNVELDPDYNYTLDFDNKQAQQAYFQNKVSNKLSINEEYSFVRADESVKVQASIEDLDGVNYIMYKNDTRWHYAFITKKEYVSTSVTRLLLKYDVYQTFMFDFSIEESFIDREHQDRFYSSLSNPLFSITPENIDIGQELFQKDVKVLKQVDRTDVDMYWVMVVSTQGLTGGEAYSSTDPSTWYNQIATSLVQNGHNMGIHASLIPIDRKDRWTKFVVPDQYGKDVELYSGILGTSTASEAVLSLRVLPYCPLPFKITNITASGARHNTFRIEFESGYKLKPVNNIDPNFHYDENHIIAPLKASNTNWGGINLKNVGGYYLAFQEIDDTIEYKKIGNISRHSFGSLPEMSQNNEKNIQYETKLFTYPYQYYEISDFRSDPIEIRNENLNSSCDIYIKQALGVQQKTKIYPNGYLGDNGKEICSINTGIDELPLVTQAYTQYLSQSKASATTGVALNIGAGVLQAGIGLASGGFGLAYGLSQAVGIGQSIANEMIKKQDLKGTPPTIKKRGNNIEFDLIDNNLFVTIRQKNVKELWRIYQYFFHYGYKANEFKKPDTRSRFYFNYIKTIGANIKTNIDAEYKTQLANIFDNGVTIWHYRGSDSFKGVNNYDYENAEMALIGG